MTALQLFVAALKLFVAALDPLWQLCGSSKALALKFFVAAPKLGGSSTALALKLFVAALKLCGSSKALCSSSKAKGSSTSL